MDVDEVFIIGAGPAGMAAALQLKRYGITPRLFEKARPGGLLWNANCVENYPGFPGGVSGPELVLTFIEQIKSIEITPEPVIKLSWEREVFYARTPSRTYQARKAIIASGTKPCILTAFPIPDDLRAYVVYEVAGLLSEEGKNILVVGSGDAAFDYAINLSRKNTVIILNRSEQVKCLPLLWYRAQAVTAPEWSLIGLLADLEAG
jgi:thioredoxin reductase (NADPH)